VLSLFAGYLMTIFVEAPFTKIQKLLINIGKKKIAKLINYKKLGLNLKKPR